LEEPEDFVIATGITTSIREFLKMTFEEIGVKLKFQGRGEKEVALIASNDGPYSALEEGRVVMKIDSRYYRPSEVDLLVGDPSKAKKMLNWEATHSLEDLVKEMVAADIEMFQKERLLVDAGFQVSSQNE